jgi:hypothetical protein
VCACELAPDHAQVAVLLHCGGLVHIGDALAQVKGRLTLADNAIHLHSTTAAGATTTAAAAAVAQTADADAQATAAT